MRRLLTAVLITFAGTAFAAKHPIDMVLPCQQNTWNGKILIVAGSLIPETVKSYKIKSYTPTGPMGEGWTTGTCVVTITKGMSD